MVFNFVEVYGAQPVPTQVSADNNVLFTVAENSMDNLWSEAQEMISWASDQLTQNCLKVLQVIIQGTAKQQHIVYVHSQEVQSCDS